MNLFETAKKKPATKAAAKKLTVNNSDKDFNKSVVELAKLNEEIAKLSAKAAVLDSELRSTGKETFLSLYDEMDKFPGTFEIEATAGKQTGIYMVIPTDRYIKIDEERSLELQKMYGPEITTKTTKYIMDSKLVEKYGKELSSAIMGCKTIPDTDKEKLISKEESFAVTKGTLHNMPRTKFITTGKKTTTVPVALSDVFDDIQPGISLKSIRIAND